MDFADALRHADEESIDSNKASCVRRLDVAFAELRREAFEQADLIV